MGPISYRAKRFYSYLIIIQVCVLGSCTQFVEIDAPATQIVSQSVFADEKTASAAMDGVYIQMIGQGGSAGFASGGSNSITVLAGLSGDEFLNHSNTQERIDFESNTLDASNSLVKNGLWSESYKIIYHTNSILEGIQNSRSLRPETRRRLEGESKFIRAFTNFYLVNLFGEIPLVVSTDYRTNNQSSRSSVSEVYDQIIFDLKEATDLLPADYQKDGEQRIRPNKYAALALLARVYLYTGNWEDAKQSASQVINNTSLYSLESDLNKVFLKKSTEVIWQLMPPGTTMNTNEGNVFILTNRPTLISLRPNLVNALDSGDLRRLYWVGTFEDGEAKHYFPYKYKVKTGSDLTEYSVILRLAEVFLTRAEANARLGNLEEAHTDLNHTRLRAGLQPAPTQITQETISTAIDNERRAELFSEWGHRWLDLKRTGRAGLVIEKQKGSWEPYMAHYPIPLSDLKLNGNLTQNVGY